MGGRGEELLAASIWTLVVFITKSGSQHKHGIESSTRRGVGKRKKITSIERGDPAKL